MAINPGDFVSGITNPYFPLTPGTTFVYEGPDGETIRVQATDETRKILGVTCTVVLDQAFGADGVLIESTYDFYAQDKDGNVWYFGESVKNYEDGKLVDKEGSWLAGVHGAEPGIVMEAAPQVGDTYNQENAPGVAEDFATVLDVSTHVATPYASSNNALQTFDGSHLDPSLQEEKFYIPGIGFVSAVDLESGDVEQLVSIEFDGTTQADQIMGNVGPDVLRGHDGNDRLQGLDGNDTIIGGLGQDTMTGGPGLDVFVFNAATETGTTAQTRDVIEDFVHNKDTIDVGNIDANTKAHGDQAFNFIGEQAFHGTAGELRYQVTQSGLLLAGDQNGDGVADFQIALSGLSTIGLGDLIL